MSDIPAYIDTARLLLELGGISDRTLRRWRDKYGFPAPKRFGLYSWAEVKAFMDGRRKRGVSSPQPVDQLQEIHDAHQTYARQGN